jgi:hypothetical protein
MAERKTISEVEFERRADRIVQIRLSTDGQYRNAENAEEQAEREQQLTEEVVAELRRKYRTR